MKHACGASVFAIMALVGCAARTPTATVARAVGGHRAAATMLLTQCATPETAAALASIGQRCVVHAPEEVSAGAELEGIAPEKGALTAALVGADELDTCPKNFSDAERDAWHDFNGESYHIDAQGRPLEAYTFLPPIAAEQRNPSCQGNVGRWGDATHDGRDYDGGHMVGSQLGGFGKRVNMVPQEKRFNEVTWVALENRVARHCKGLTPGRLLYWVGVSYTNTSTLVPAKMSMYLEDTEPGGSWIEVTFDNATDGGDHGAAEQTRGLKFLQTLCGE